MIGPAKPRDIHTVLLLVVPTTVLGLWLLAGCRPAQTSNLTTTATADRTEPSHIVLISLDTCRADRLGCYGYARAATPHIDAVAAAGILFENVISPVPMTLPAHSSMLTGTIPPYHGVHTNLGYRLGRSNVTLSELLQEEGYTTGAIVAAFVLDSQFGMNQGFETFDDRFDVEIHNSAIAERRGDEVSRHAVRWLKEHADTKSFLFLHYYDPHDPYAPPEPFASRFSADLYDGEIAYVDHCVGEVIDQLKELGIYDSTLLIITGDHGEMLGSHGEQTHSYYIYQGAVQVPLIVKLPGVDASRRVSSIVGIVDIVPTICGWLGIESPPIVHGIDLTERLLSDAAANTERAIYCESVTPTNYDANSLLGVVTGRWKYIQTTRPELYDLISDPQESNNLADGESHRAELLQDQLREQLDTTIPRQEDSRTEMDEETLRRLSSLGYVGGTTNEEFDFDESKDDPKDLIDFHQRCGKIERLIMLGKLAEAHGLCELVLDERPGYLYAYVHLAKIAVAQDELPRAVGYYEQSLERDPNQPRVHNSMGLVYLKMGRNGKALAAYEKAIELDPEFAEPRYNLGLISTRLGNVDQAIESFRKVLEIDPGDQKARTHLTETLMKRGQGFLEADELDLARQDLEEVWRLDSSAVEAANGLAQIADRQQRQEDAIVHLQDSLRLHPQQPRMHENLLRIYAHLGQTTELIQACRTALEVKPDWPWMLQALSVALASDGQLEEAIKSAEKALEVARTAGETDRVAEIEQQLESFRAELAAEPSSRE